MQSTLWGPPVADAVRLPMRPQVLSWDRAGTWAQERLVPYRAHIAASYPITDLTMVSIDLHCGLSGAASLETAGDLDNYIVPVADALGWAPIVAAWASKDLSTDSTLAVGFPSQLTLKDEEAWESARVRTTASTSTTAWKEQVAAALVGVTPEPGDGEVEVVIAFTVGPGRAWRNLWKPAIDATGAVLGEGPRKWHPRDGRISRLGLSRTVDETLGWDVELEMSWRPRGANASTGPRWGDNR
jgi:hypothetical protein